MRASCLTGWADPSSSRYPAAGEKKDDDEVPETAENFDAVEEADEAK